LIIHISESAKEDFTEEQYVQILQKAEGIPGAFWESYAKKKKRTEENHKGPGEAYPVEIRSFSLSLHMYSPKAYR
jgi:hypothetical protein